MLISYTYLPIVDADVRLSRRIQRDTVERGRNIQNVLEQVSVYSLLSFRWIIKALMLISYTFVFSILSLWSRASMNTFSRRWSMLI